MIILFVVKQFINRKYAKKLIAPVPIELVVVSARLGEAFVAVLLWNLKPVPSLQIIFSTLFSYLFEFNERWNVSIVGDIPAGFPTPSFPPANLFSVLFGDALSIAVVSFAVNLSMTKLYAKQFNYSIHGNQVIKQGLPPTKKNSATLNRSCHFAKELVAYGVSNVVCSVFSGFPICVGLSRSAILVGTKSMTLMYTVLSNTILMVIILAVGSLLRDLPHVSSCPLAVFRKFISPEAQCDLPLPFSVCLRPSLRSLWFGCCWKSNKSCRSTSEARPRPWPGWPRSAVWSFSTSTTASTLVLAPPSSSSFFSPSGKAKLLLDKVQQHSVWNSFATCSAHTSILGNIPHTDIYECATTCKDVRTLLKGGLVRIKKARS